MASQVCLPVRHGRSTFLQPSVGRRRSPRKDGFDINSNGAINAILSPNDAEAQALGREEESMRQEWGPRYSLG